LASVIGIKYTADDRRLMVVDVQFTTDLYRDNQDAMSASIRMRRRG